MLYLTYLEELKEVQSPLPIGLWCRGNWLQKLQMRQEFSAAQKPSPQPEQQATTELFSCGESCPIFAAKR